MGKGTDYSTPAPGLGLPAAGQVGGRRLFATPAAARLPAITGTATLGILQGTFAAPLTAVTAIAPAAGTTAGAWLGTHTAVAYGMAAAARIATVMAVPAPRRAREKPLHAR